MQEFRLESYDKTPIFVRLWDDVENPKAVLQLAHGMAECGVRYDEFARFMNTQGYIVFADDHRAHGLTETDENRGRHKGDIAKKTVNDLVFFYGWLKEKYQLPIVFLGHSYGSFLAQAFLQQRLDVKGVALCGSAYMNGAQLGLAALWPFKLFCPNWRPRFVNKGSDLLFNVRYKNEKGPSLWITRDLQKREEFIADPLLGIDTSMNFIWGMVKMFGRIYTNDAKMALNLDTPVTIFSGTMDPIGGTHAKKAKRLLRFYQNVGLRNVSLKLYEDARHELLNETNRLEVFSDIAHFFDSCIE